MSEDTAEEYRPHHHYNIEHHGHRPLRRKSCPDGSDEFQQVLTDFFGEEENEEDKSNEHFYGEHFLSHYDDIGGADGELVCTCGALNNNNDSHPDLELEGHDIEDSSGILTHPHTEKAEGCSPRPVDMGTSCSTNHIERNSSEWLDVALAHKDNGDAISLCTCQNGECNPTTETNGKLKTIDPGDTANGSTSVKTSSDNANKGSPESKQNQRSKESSSSKPIIRLLSRRSTMAVSHPGSNSDSRPDSRQRSHSWSQGKSKKSDKTSVSLIRVRSPILSPVGNSKAVAPLKSGSSSNSSNNTGNEKSFTSSSSGTNNKTSTPPSKAKIQHKKGCPLYQEPQNVFNGKSKQQRPGIDPKLLNDSYDVQDDLSPVNRRRAASESHKASPRTLATRSRDFSDTSCSHDHAHVHWADEEKGCSLSTCVFLTSIRPRSYSHGATDIPHKKPILKKVAGL